MSCTVMQTVPCQVLCDCVRHVVAVALPGQALHTASNIKHIHSPQHLRMPCTMLILWPLPLLQADILPSFLLWRLPCLLLTDFSVCLAPC